MKGADQCPRCGSRKSGEVVNGVYDFYAARLRVCANCKTAWEPFDEAALLDAGERFSCFVDPCDNCAFRKGSPEARDPDGFRALLGRLGWFEGRFYCHKGVPITPGKGDGFDYPKDVKRLRLCRGYLNWLGSTEAKAKLSLALMREAVERQAAIIADGRWADDGGPGP